MRFTHLFRRYWLPTLLVLAVLASTVAAQVRVGPVPVAPNGYRPAAGARQPAGQPAYRVAERAPVKPILAAAELLPAQPNEHPLMPALRWAHDGLRNIKRIQDYTATVVKRERLDGEVQELQYMFLKVRHKPFSVYAYFLGPAELKGRETIYIEGQNDGNMWAHGTGVQRTMFGTLSLPPKGMIAMRGQRYPLTDIGVLNLVERLIEVAEQDRKYGECKVEFFKGAKINKRSCTCIQVVHPVPRSNFLFHLARIYVDDELNVPIRYASYDWPKKPGDSPEVLEEYTYLNMKLNCGLTDADFDIRNPNYNFP